MRCSVRTIRGRSVVFSPHSSSSLPTPNKNEMVLPGFDWKERGRWPRELSGWGMGSQPTSPSPPQTCVQPSHRPLVPPHLLGARRGGTPTTQVARGGGATSWLEGKWAGLGGVKDGKSKARHSNGNGGVVGVREGAGVRPSAPLQLVGRDGILQWDDGGLRPGRVPTQRLPHVIRVLRRLQRGAGYPRGNIKFEIYTFWIIEVKNRK